MSLIKEVGEVVKDFNIATWNINGELTFLNFLQLEKEFVQ
jgi:hypothetical protein